MNERLGTRTYSIWLSQLLLAVVVVVVVLLVQGLDPETLGRWTFTVGVSAIVVLTALALIVPWPRLPTRLVLIIPALDIIAVGVMAIDTDIDLGFLWVFPITWIATHFGVWPMVGSLALVGTIVVWEESTHADSSSGTLRLIIVLLSLTFIAISAFTVSRQTRAFKRLLRRQASKLNDALTRTTRQERHVSQVLDSIDVGVVGLAADGSIQGANLTYRTLYGIDLDALAADALMRPGAVEYGGFKGVPLSIDERPLARAQRGEQFTDVRTWLFDSTGAWLALSLSVRPVPEDALLENAGPGAGAGQSLLIAHDITATSRAERARDALTRRVSHELRNPLSTIIGFSELILDSDGVDTKVHDRVEAINMAAERMLTLAGEILEMGRDVQPVEPSVGRTDLGRVATESIESFMPMADAGGVGLRLDVAEDIAVMGDAFRLRQVVDNLLSNAIKYTPKGGSVTVQVETSADQSVLRVTDTGIGMQPDEVSRIFEPYFRAEAARQSDIVGTGLGMDIVHTLVTEHHGTLQVDSAVGQGTTVIVRFDRSPDPEPDIGATLPMRPEWSQTDV